ncbi:MAG: hypothetical protein WBF99_22160 [Xanthobacteraceae bacterium]
MMASIFFTESLPALQILQMADVVCTADAAGRRGGTMVAMWFVDDLSNAEREAQRAKSDADQLPESDGVFHVGPAAFYGSYRCINGQYAHFSGSRAFCCDRAEIALLAFEAMRGGR